MLSAYQVRSGKRREIDVRQLIADSQKTWFEAEASVRNRDDVAFAGCYRIKTVIAERVRQCQ